MTSQAIHENLKYRLFEDPLGRVAVVWGREGVRGLVFEQRGAPLLAELFRCWPGIQLSQERSSPQGVGRLDVVGLLEAGSRRLVPLHPGGTLFQTQVWEALRAIPMGHTHTYGQVAQTLGRAGSARAVAQACAANPIALLIPCHRVVPEAGGAGGYRWGAARKKALLALEQKLHARA